MTYRLRIVEDAAGDTHLQQILSDGRVFELEPTAEDKERTPGTYDSDWMLIEAEPPPSKRDGADDAGATE